MGAVARDGQVWVLFQVVASDMFPDHSIVMATAGRGSVPLLVRGAYVSGDASSFTVMSVVARLEAELRGEIEV